MKTVTLESLKEAARKAGMAKFAINKETRDDMYVIGRDFIERLFENLPDEVGQK